MVLRFFRPLLLAPLLASFAFGQSPANPEPFGSWTLVSAPDLAQVVEAATASMNFVTRPIARARLKKAFRVFPTLRIERGADDLAIQYGDRVPQRMPADGREVEWTREDGERMHISARLDQDDLIQHYRAEDGERTNVFHVDVRTKALTMEVTITSPRLPGPVTYAVTYR